MHKKNLDKGKMKLKLDEERRDVVQKVTISVVELEKKYVKADQTINTSCTWFMVCFRR
jgi:hypothetical protein